jgi:methionine biosynthesis protein MetW
MQSAVKYDCNTSKKALKHIETHGLAPTHKRIVDMIGNNRAVLDVGCATGYLAEAIAANECRVTGIELDTDAAEKASRFCRNVITGDAGDSDVLKQAGKSFDYIVCADILEHLADPWMVLSTFHGMLVKDGEVIVSVPNIAYWQMRWKLLLGRFDYTETGLLDRTHLRFFTVRTFIQTAESSGYDLIEMVVNDAGFPGFRYPRDWQKLPEWMRWFFKKCPNLCVYHAIYRLRPKKGS